MKEKEISFRKITVALLPVLLESLHFRHAFFLGAVTSFSLWGAVLFFHGTRLLFPERLLRTAFLLWLAAFAQIGWYLLDLRPFWMASLGLLGSDFILEERTKGIEIKVILWEGIGFWGMLAYLGLFQEYLGRQWSLGLFDQPVGSFLLLMLASLFWKRQPEVRKSQQPLKGMRAGK
jgi:hypothetical protein